jgi:hypothetical protein
MSVPDLIPKFHKVGSRLPQDLNSFESAFLLLSLSRHLISDRHLNIHSPKIQQRLVVTEISHELSRATDLTTYRTEDNTEHTTRRVDKQASLGYLTDLQDLAVAIALTCVVLLQVCQLAYWQWRW